MCQWRKTRNAHSFTEKCTWSIKDTYPKVLKALPIPGVNSGRSPPVPGKCLEVLENQGSHGQRNLDWKRPATWAFKNLSKLRKGFVHLEFADTSAGSPPPPPVPWDC